MPTACAGLPGVARPACFLESLTRASLSLAIRIEALSDIFEPRFSRGGEEHDDWAGYALVWSASRCSRRMKEERLKRCHKMMENIASRSSVPTQAANWVCRCRWDGYQVTAQTSMVIWPLGKCYHPQAQFARVESRSASSRAGAWNHVLQELSTTRWLTDRSHVSLRPDA